MEQNDLKQVQIDQGRAECQRVLGSTCL